MSDYFFTHLPSTAEHIPLFLQATDSAQSSSLVASQKPFTGEHLPTPTHCSDLLHSIYVVALQKPLTNEHLPYFLQLYSDLAQCSSLVTLQTPLTNEHLPKTLQPSDFLHSIIFLSKCGLKQTPLIGSQLNNFPQSEGLTHRLWQVLVNWSQPRFSPQLPSFGQGLPSLEHAKASKESESKSKNLMLSPEFRMELIDTLSQRLKEDDKCSDQGVDDLIWRRMMMSDYFFTHRPSTAEQSPYVLHLSEPLQSKSVLAIQKFIQKGCSSIEQAPSMPHAFDDTQSILVLGSHIPIRPTEHLPCIPQSRDFLQDLFEPTFRKGKIIDFLQSPLYRQSSTSEVLDSVSLLTSMGLSKKSICGRMKTNARPTKLAEPRYRQSHISLSFILSPEFRMELIDTLSQPLKEDDKCSDQSQYHLLLNPHP